ncbi:thiol reductant ABC exporter subunit CydD [Bordetella muralis]
MTSTQFDAVDTASGSGTEAARLAREQSRWLSAQARVPRLPLIVAVGAPLLGGVLLVVQAWLLARVLDAAIVSQAPRSALLGDIALIIVLMLVRAGLAWASERAGAHAAESIKQRIRVALFDRLVGRGPVWSRTQVSGELASAIVDQVEALDGFFSRYLPAAVSAAILPLAFAVVLLPFDWIAGLLLLVTAPLIPLFMALVGWGAEAASRRHVRAFARLSGFFADRLRGLSTLKLYGRAQAEASSVAMASEAVRKRTLSVLRIAFLSSAVLEFFAALGVAGMAVYFGLSYLGFLDVRATPLTLQVGFFCLLMAPETYAPLRQFAAHYHDRAAARAAAAQIAASFEGLPDTSALFGDSDIAAVEPVEVHAAVASDEDSAKHSSSGGSGVAVSADARAVVQWGATHVTGTSADTCAAGFAVSVHGLSLQAPGRISPVMDDASLSLSAGEHVALMGPSGSGKTTLLEVLSRLRPCAGHIMLDDVPLAEWDETLLRERVALIGQRPFLFAASIADNIRLGRPQATDEQVIEAARRARVMTFAEPLREGLDTMLGPRGRGLSGGQAQRVALARLFLRDPGLILLDESTASLDETTQSQVLDEILAFAHGRTLLLATHASAVAQRLPRTVTLIDGKLEPA